MKEEGGQLREGGRWIPTGSYDDTIGPKYGRMVRVWHAYGTVWYPTLPARCASMQALTPRGRAGCRGAIAQLPARRRLSIYLWCTSFACSLLASGQLGADSVPSKTAFAQAAVLFPGSFHFQAFLAQDGELGGGRRPSIDLGALAAAAAKAAERGEGNGDPNDEHEN